MKKYFLMCLLLAVSFVETGCASIELHDYEKWWEYNCGRQDKFNLFAGWIGDETEPSRVLVRQYILNKGYKKILDVPCGLCVDFKGFNAAGLDYLGVDITPLFVKRATDLGISVLLGRIQDIPCAESSVDVTVSRHILEHLPSYEDAITQLIRVAKNEVVIIFFRKPSTIETDSKIIVDYVDGFPIYHNIYSKSKLEKFLTSNQKVKNFNWKDVNGTAECVLSIVLKD